MFDLLKKPFYIDWIFYLWIVSMIAILPGTLFSPKNGGGIGSFLIGSVVQYLVFLTLLPLIRTRWNKMQENASFEKTSGKTNERKATNRTKSSPDTNSVSVKVCAECETEAGPFRFECWQCGGTTFLHKSVPKEPKIEIPEMKICPMCAEEIKFAAKKCRYCSHLIEE